MILGYAGPMPLQLKIGLLLILLAAIALCIELRNSACDDFIGKLVFTLLAAGFAVLAACMLAFA